jgi:hypothetical protein
MTPKVIKKTLRFLENLLFIRVQEPTFDIPRVRSLNDVTLESQPYEGEEDLKYGSLRFPKKVPVYPLFEPGSSVVRMSSPQPQPAPGVEPSAPPPLSILPTLPTLLHMDELENLIFKTQTLCQEMERNSAEIDDLEKRSSGLETLETLETLV